MKLTGAEIIIKVLKEEGVDTVFGYPGGAVLNIYDALYKHSSEIKHITTAHEQGAAHAADAYARVTGKTGVVIATSGPGATNLITGLATAYHDSVPLVAITGNVNRELMGLLSFQEVDISSIARPVTKWSTVADAPDSLADTLRKAFKIARSGRPRPVLVDIPKDITALLGEYEEKTPEKEAPVLPHSANIEAARELILNAKRPVILAGGGVVRARAERELIAFAEHYDIPVGNTLMGTGLMDGHPLKIGLVGMHGRLSATRACREADLLIAIGTRFSDRVATDRNRFTNSEASIIQIDVDPLELGKNLFCEVKIAASIAESLSALTNGERTSHKEWVEGIAEWRKGEKIYRESDKFPHPAEIIDCICKNIPQGTAITTDVGQHQMWTAQGLYGVSPYNFCTSGGLGAMGYGLGAAVGAHMGTGKPVVHITGDGSFHMNCNELCTAVSYDCPIVTVVFDNDALGMVRQWQKVFYEERYSQTSLKRRTDFARLAEAYGGDGYRAFDLDDFERAFKIAIKRKKPAVIDVVLNPDERVLPMIPPGQSLEEIILK